MKKSWRYSQALTGAKETTLRTISDSCPVRRTGPTLWLSFLCSHSLSTIHVSLPLLSRSFSAISLVLLTITLVLSPPCPSHPTSLSNPIAERRPVPENYSSSKPAAAANLLVYHQDPPTARNAKQETCQNLQISAKQNISGRLFDWFSYRRFSAVHYFQISDKFMFN